MLPNWLVKLPITNVTPRKCEEMDDRACQGTSRHRYPAGQREGRALCRAMAVSIVLTGLPTLSNETRLMNGAEPAIHLIESAGSSWRGVHTARQSPVGLPVPAAFRGSNATCMRFGAKRKDDRH